MSTATMAQITVEAKSKFGVLDGKTKKWMNPLQKSLLTQFELGKSYDLKLDKVKGDDGKVREYITEAKATGKAVEAAVAPPVSAPVTSAKSSDKGLSFSEKDSRILVQGLVQAVLQSPLMNMIPDNAVPLKFVENTTVELMDIVKRLSGTK